jgi:hypothetical protein
MLHFLRFAAMKIAFINHFNFIPFSLYLVKEKKRVALIKLEKKERDKVINWLPF